MAELLQVKCLSEGIQYSTYMFVSPSLRSSRRKRHSTWKWLQLSQKNLRYNTVPLIQQVFQSIFFQVAELTHFLRMNDSRLQFIWSSEISGFRHLYLATANSNHTLTRARAGSFISECCIHYPLVTQRQLTDGDWEVDGKEVSKLM